VVAALAIGRIIYSYIGICQADFFRGHKFSVLAERQNFPFISKLEVQTRKRYGRVVFQLETTTSCVRLSVPAADEEDPSILSNVEWETLSDRGFDDLRYLSRRPHGQVCTIFTDFGYPDAGVVAQVQDGMCVLFAQVGGEMGQQDLDGNDAIKSRVSGAVYLAMAPAPSAI